MPVALLGSTAFYLDPELLLPNVILSTSEAVRGTLRQHADLRTRAGTYVMPTSKAAPASRIGSAHCRQVLRTGFAAAQDDITIPDAAIHQVVVFNHSWQSATA